MLLSIKNRQKDLKILGFYSGVVDGKEGKLTKEAYKKIQKRYFPKKYVDGKYGRQTDILIKNAMHVFNYCKNFKLEEFKCECGGRYCTGYPVIFNYKVLQYLQSIRNEVKQSVTITSGLRCQRYNDSLKGSIKGSKHTKGKAIDFYCGKTSTLAGRKRIMDMYIKWAKATYTYCNGYYRFKTSRGKISSTYMGSSIHVDVL